MADDALAKPFVELGATGLRQFSGYVREEWLRDLQGWRGIRILKEMRDNDPIVGAVFFAIENLLRGVSFRIQPADVSKPEDVEAAAFVNSCWADMEQSWPDLLSEVLTFLQFGWSVHEIVYKRRKGRTSDPKTNSRFDDGLVGWRKFGGRAQETLLHWEFDESGDATAMVQLLPTGGPLLRVPLAKSLHFKTTNIKGNPEGRTLLRNAYTSYYFKKRLQEIEAVGVERDLAGVPVAWVPPRILQAGASKDDQQTFAAIKKIVVDTYRNELEGFIFPLAYDKDGHKTFDFTLLSTGGQRQFDTTKIIDRYDQRIAATFLADFITLGGSGSSSKGSYAQSKNKTDMFALAVSALLDIIANEFNRKAIPDLLAINGMDGQVQMVHGDVARTDLEALGAYVQSIALAGALVPDAPLEAHLREEAGLPPAEMTGETSINDGGPVSQGSTDPADTASADPGARQGQGDDGAGGSGVDPRSRPKPRGG